MRGGLSTRDHDYGIFNNIHHDIGTHVVHHLFPQVGSPWLVVLHSKRLSYSFAPCCDRCSFRHGLVALCAMVITLHLMPCGHFHWLYTDAPLPYSGSDEGGEAGARRLFR